MDFVDCQGFAGGFTLGVVQAGLRLVGKRELPGGFGLPSCEANRHLLGDEWKAEVGPWDTWTPKDVPVVIGNPPCSGFSLMSRKEWRGVDSPVNSCMHALAAYAARCRPEVVMFESVQQAYSQGRPLMQALRAGLEERTGLKYTLVHVLQNGSMVGGPAWRPRYLATFTRVPFGVERPEPEHVVPPTWGGLLRDLVDQPMSWEPIAYASNGDVVDPWVRRELRSPHGVVDGHACVAHDAPLWVRMRAVEEVLPNGWREGMNVSMALRECYETHGRLPLVWERWQDRLVAKDFSYGFHQPNRWRSDGRVRVMTGGAAGLVIHPFRFRPLTVREVMRGQGFPDDWRVAELPRTSGAASYWGKGIPVEVGRWAGTWIRESVEGAPGRLVGYEIGDRERLIDITRL